MTQLVSQYPSWGRSGDIVYYRIETNGEKRGLWTIREGGSRQFLTDGDLPSWDAEGRRVVFMQSGNVMMWDAETRDVHQITRGTRGFFPSWSPDGMRIAFDRTTPADSAGIWVVDAATGDNLARLTPPGARTRCPTWSPDGSQIAFAMFDGAGGANLYAMSLMDRRMEQLTFVAMEDEILPRWSPDGKSIAYSTAEGIHVLDLESKHDRLLAATEVRCLADWQAAAWSPDNRRLVYSKDVLWVINADGTGDKRIE
jgi:Tol biopolymer transport system component